MDEPDFLTLEEVLEIHQHQIENYGGSNGIRDPGLLESALAQPRQMFGGNYLHPDLASMAAAYLFHIASNHAFIDGNKRTGAHAALVFLGMNGIDIDFPLEKTEMLVLGVASGEIGKEDVVKFFTKLLKDV